jgi:hypothetical protein
VAGDHSGELVQDAGIVGGHERAIGPS